LIDACKNNVRVRLFLNQFQKRFVSGHDFSRVVAAAKEEGFRVVFGLDHSIRLNWDRYRASASSGPVEPTGPLPFDGLPRAISLTPP
jgi:hypothetical protein